MEPDSFDGTAAWEKACSRFGTATLRYLFNLDPEATQPDFTVPTIRSVIDTCAGDDLRRIPRPQYFSVACGVFLQIAAGTAFTHFEMLRAITGQRPQQPSNLVEALARLVRHGLLLEQFEGAEDRRFEIAAAFQTPELVDPVTVAFLEDEELSTLLPQQTPQDDPARPDNAVGLLWWSPGGGGTLFSQIVIGAIVEQTLARMRFRDALDESRIEEFVVESVDQLRRFAQGEPVDVVVMKGLDHIDVQGCIERETWGIRGADGLAIETFGESETRPRPRSIMWQTVPFHLVAAMRNEVDENTSLEVFQQLTREATAHRSGLFRHFDAVAFAILAHTHTSESRVSLATSGPWDLFPLQPTQAPLRIETLAQEPTVLSQGDLDEIAIVVDGITPVNDSMTIALTRITKSFTERRAQDDALIDAVIAWENMVGSRSETTFKVCSALAWLLEPEHAERRAALFNRCTKIYGVRSRLVHGDTDAILSSEDVDDAIRIATEAFKRIHGDARLRAMNSSSKRASHLTLQSASAQ
ncbi:HEPN domain-containing protein [Paramicrobacterium humi]|uniref:HEPN domain-containing protein n=1 Tax=Paramicrobacterium humi TaxID=640635 RepID=UPI00115FAF86|nr:HEPN domain-containing protein [Microbacterium humi]